MSLEDPFRLIDKPRCDNWWEVPDCIATSCMTCLPSHSNSPFPLGDVHTNHLCLFHITMLSASMEFFMVPKISSKYLVIFPTPVVVHSHSASLPQHYRPLPYVSFQASLANFCFLTLASNSMTRRALSPQLSRRNRLRPAMRVSVLIQYNLGPTPNEC